MKKKNQKTHFEHIPVEVVKRVAQLDGSSSLTQQVICAICEEPVTLEHCKINEDGEAVHDSCYLARLTLCTPKAGRSRPER